MGDIYFPPSSVFRPLSSVVCRLSSVIWYFVRPLVYTGELYEGWLLNG